MQYEGLSAKATFILNLVINVAISTGVAVYLYDGWDAVLYGLAYFALMNVMDAVIGVIQSKKKEE